MKVELNTKKRHDVIEINFHSKEMEENKSKILKESSNERRKLYALFTREDAWFNKIENYLKDESGKMREWAAV